MIIVCLTNLEIFNDSQFTDGYHVIIQQVQTNPEQNCPIVLVGHGMDRMQKVLSLTLD